MKKLNLRGMRWGVILCVLAFVLLSGYLLYSYITLNEVNSELLAAQKELTRLEGEEGSLQVALESKTPMEEVERIATEELGMVKLEGYQVQVINLQTDDEVKIVQDESQSSSWLDGVVEQFNILWEYLS